MALPMWLQILQTVGLAALQASPLAPIAIPVASAIAAAESMPGLSGQDKLSHVLSIAKDAATSAQALGVNISPSMVEVAGASAISTAVTVTNLVHETHKAGATPTA